MSTTSTDWENATDAPQGVHLTDVTELLGACAWPSEAFWRVLELGQIRRHLPFPAPVLELGCGDGVFTSLAGVRVDHAIDIQANAVARASAITDTYRAVTRLDLHDLASSQLGPFRTIFANSVLEHVADLQPVLAACQGLLLPGGKLVTSVPLAEMNSHLMIRAQTYTKVRQATLQHRNLWALQEWTARLQAAGFATVESTPYLDGAATRYWDSLDALGAVGVGRYRVAPAVHRLLSVTLPGPQKRALKDQIGRRLLARAQRASESSPCAAVLIASTPE